MASLTEVELEKFWHPNIDDRGQNHWVPIPAFVKTRNTQVKVLYSDLFKVGEETFSVAVVPLLDG